jgi:FdhD protein
MSSRKSKTRIERIEVRGEVAHSRSDVLATEEPLEVRLEAGSGRKGQRGKLDPSASSGPALSRAEGRKEETGRIRQTVTVTMRTPGHDFELAAGFLFAEGVIGGKEAIGRIAYCTDRDEPQQYNIVNVELKAQPLPELGGLERHFFSTSACGVCGKAGLERLELRGYQPLPINWQIKPSLLRSLPARLRKSQGLFESTGGIHAAALFDLEGRLVATREDVGRHNALDKLIGWALLEDKLPLSQHIIVVSGRASYELTQKALAAGVGILAAISAPSSLAVELAKQFNQTLVGFLRDKDFNIYSAPERILLA